MKAAMSTEKHHETKEAIQEKAKPNIRELLADGVVFISAIQAQNEHTREWVRKAKEVLGHHE